MESNYSVLALVYGAGMVGHLLCRAAVIVVIVTVVRRHRPDASSAILLWAIAVVATSILLWVLNAAGPLIATGNAGSSYGLIQWQEINALLNVIAEVGLTMLLARGLIALAVPPKGVVSPADGAYR